MTVQRRQLGPRLQFTPEQLDQAAEVTPVDVLMAKALWQQHAPVQLFDLLDAAREEDPGGNG